MSEPDTVCIYNADGSLWYEFSDFPTHSLFYKKQPNPDFKPFEIEISVWTGLRLKAASKLDFIHFAI